MQDGYFSFCCIFNWNFFANLILFKVLYRSLSGLDWAWLFIYILLIFRHIDISLFPHSAGFDNKWAHEEDASSGPDAPPEKKTLCMKFCLSDIVQVGCQIK